METDEDVKSRNSSERGSAKKKRSREESDDADKDASPPKSARKTADGPGEPSSSKAQSKLKKEHVEESKLKKEHVEESKLKKEHVEESKLKKEDVEEGEIGQDAGSAAAAAPTGEDGFSEVTDRKKRKKLMQKAGLVSIISTHTPDEYLGDPPTPRDSRANSRVGMSRLR
jgi:hypothetical protein